MLSSTVDAQIVLRRAFGIARPFVRPPDTRHDVVLECRRSGGAEEQLTGLRTDGFLPHGPRVHRVIKRLDGPPSSCSQIQTRWTHAHPINLYNILDILWRRVIYKCVAGHSLQYTRISRIIRLTEMHITLHLALAAIIGFGVSNARQQEHDIAYYIHQCQKSAPNVNECLTYSANHLAMHFRKGIPELGIEEVEPIVIDEINLSLGSGPDGYRATFKDIQAYGVSNLTVNQVRSDLNSLQFQLTFSIPKISAIANYRSSGVLIMVQATGGGEYWGEYEGVKAKVYIKASEVERNSQKYLHLEDLKMDFSVKDIQMGIKNVHNGNAVLEAALNLFINSNSQELLKEMKPHIKKKLMVAMKTFIDNLFSRVPYDNWVIE